jgi:hypothetical protein
MKRKQMFRISLQKKMEISFNKLTIRKAKIKNSKSNLPTMRVKKQIILMLIDLILMDYGQ